MQEIREGQGGFLFSKRYVSLSGWGIFLGTQFAAIIVGVLYYPNYPTKKAFTTLAKNAPWSLISQQGFFLALLVFDVVSLGLVAAILYRNRRARYPNRKPMVVEKVNQDGT